MLTIAVDTQRRHWTKLWRRRFQFGIPEGWHELKRPERWYAMAMHNATAARAALLRKYVPLRWLLALPKEELGGLLHKLQWLQITNDCTTVPLARYKHRGVVYHLPGPDAQNMTTAEFAVCNDLYDKIIASDDAALIQLTCTLYRPANKDHAEAARRGDVRVAFTHTNESDARAKAMGKVPEVMKAQALMYFGGVKKWVSDIYGPYIFEEPDYDDDGNPLPAQTDDGPNFGWWGVLQAVAEGGVFGTLDQVYQANLHEVCIYLVRKKQEADKLRQASQSTRNVSENIP